MTSLNNLNYYRRSMNGVQSFDDGMGGTMEDGVISCNSFTTDNFTATSLNATTGNITTANITTGNINTVNSYNIGTDSIVANIGTINTLNTTTGNIGTLNSDAITNSGGLTTTYLNIKNGGFVYIGDTSTYSEQFINTDTNIYRYILYPPINRSIWTINGNDILELDDTKITVPQINSTIGNITTINSTIINSNDIKTNYGTIKNISTENITANLINTNSLICNDKGTFLNISTTNLTSDTADLSTIDTTFISSINSFFNNATITTLNSTTLNVSTINASNVNSNNGSITALNTNTIQAQTTTNAVNLFTTNTADINIGGTGKIYLNKSGYNGLEFGLDTTGSLAPYIDFHSSGNNNNYDASIYCDGGTTTNAEGNLTLKAKQIILNGIISFSSFLKTQVTSVKTFNNTYQNTNTTPKFVSISASATIPATWLYAKSDTNTTPTTIVAQTTLYNSVAQSMFFIVLPNYYYRVESTTGSLLNWTEWS